MGEPTSDQPATALAAIDLKIPPAIRAQLDEIATLLLQIYQTLVSMRYLPPTAIIPGPHPLLPAWRRLNLDDTILYLFTVLPYIDHNIAGLNTDFIHGSSFVNYLDESSLATIADPFYASPSGTDFEAPSGPYMRPWMVPLSQLGNHGSVLLYDARAHTAWLIDQESWASTDPMIGNRRAPRGKTKNVMDLRTVPSRPADDVLRDIDQAYRWLRILPGGGELAHDEWAIPEKELRVLYQKHGWPDAFDGDAFEVGQLRALSANKAMFAAQEPLRQVKCFVDWSRYAEHRIQDAKQRVDEAETEEDKWMARYELWKAEDRKAWNAQELMDAKKEADRLCPGGVCQRKEELPLWEAEMARHLLKWARETVAGLQGRVEESRGEPEREKILLADLLRAEKRAEFHEKAFEASKADADRLCPSKTFREVTGIETLGRQDVLTQIKAQDDTLLEVGNNLVKIRAFAETVPVHAEKVHEKMQADIKQQEQQIDSAKTARAGFEKWLQEHGNTD